MSTMTKTTLREQIQSRHTRYRLDKVAVLCLRPAREVPMMKDGIQHLHTEPPVFISRIGDGKMGPFTQQFDTTVPEIAEYVEFVDDFIERNPRAARNAGLSKLNDERPPTRVLNWDNMNVDQIATVLDATRVDLTWAMEYELLRPDKVADLTGELIDGGPREDVIQIIEDMFAYGYERDVEQSDEAPDLS